MDEGRPKIEDIHIRISQEAKDEIKEYIKEHKLNLSSFVRDCCLETIKASKENKHNG